LALTVDGWRSTVASDVLYHPEGCMPDHDDELLTTAEVAQLCRTVPSTVRYWRFTGEGPPGFKVGTRVLYWRSQVLAWLAAKQQDEALSRAG
jgi:predicted DNA-binding transcriptional regulator AlpA